LLVIRVAPLRRKTTGAFTPKTPWLHYAGNPVAPLRRKRNGSYMPEIHTAAGQTGRNSEGQGWHEKAGNSDGDFIMHLSQLSVGMLPL
jgi:hypothetical protein